MRLIVMVPAYNEEDTIGDVIKNIPRKIDGVQEVKVLVIEDGSTDRTVEVAKDAGADRIVSQRVRMGLARAFDKGLDIALKMGADLIVNIDADGQYDPKEIPKLIQPILNGEADIVLGNRQIDKLTHMSFSRKIGNKIATFVTNKLSGLNISDSQTGFRAFSRRAALMLSVLSDYTYTQETLIQAAYKKLRIVEVPIEFRERKGKSRLVSSLLSYAKRSGLTILLTYLNYKPLKTFSIIGLAIVTIGLLLGFRVLVHFYKTGTISPYIPTTILVAMLVIVGFQVILMGLFASMVKSNRELIEKILYRIKEMGESSE
jgi:glycosyltransferase involved in cell wall biosynthesis